MTMHQAPALQALGQAPAAPPPVTAPDGHAGSPAGRMVRNALALSFARPLTWAAAIGMTILLPRYLGDVNLGKINFAFAFADWCGLLASLGISTYLTKEVASRAKGGGSLILNALLLRLVLALGVGGLAMLLASLLDYDELTRQLVYLLSAHMLLTVIAGVLVGALQGMQHLKAVAVIDSISKVAQLGLVAIALVTDYGPIGVAVGFVLSDVIAIVAYAYAVWRHGGLNGRPDLRSWWALTRGGVPFLVWETALLTYARVDVIIMAMFAHAAVLGWYNAAYRIISIPLFFPVIVMTVTFPALSAAANDQVLFRSIARRAVHTVVLVTVPATLGLMILAEKLIDFLGYPESFAGSVMPIVILATTVPLVAVNMIVGSALAAQDRQRQWAVAGVGAAILNPALNLLAIPYTQTEFGNAGIGAAAVTALTEVYLLIAGQYFLPQGIFGMSTIVGALKCLLAGLAMAAVVWAVRDLPILLSVPVGVLVYGAASLLLGAVSLGDVRRVRGYVQERRTSTALNAA